MSSPSGAPAARGPETSPSKAGTAVAYGLPREIAVEAITIRPARFFGVDDRIGSLEVGKWADVIVTAGDPFEITSQVRHQFIQGNPVDLANRHTRLYDRYRKRLTGDLPTDPTTRKPRPGTPTSPDAAPATGTGTGPSRDLKEKRR